MHGHGLWLNFLVLLKNTLSTREEFSPGPPSHIFWKQAHSPGIVPPWSLAKIPCAAQKHLIHQSPKEFSHGPPSHIFWKQSHSPGMVSPWGLAKFLCAAQKHLIHQSLKEFSHGPPSHIFWKQARSPAMVSPWSLAKFPCAAQKHVIHQSPKEFSPGPPSHTFWEGSTGLVAKLGVPCLSLHPLHQTLVLGTKPKFHLIHIYHTYPAVAWDSIWYICSMMICSLGMGFAWHIWRAHAISTISRWCRLTRENFPSFFLREVGVWVSSCQCGCPGCINCFCVLFNSTQENSTLITLVAWSLWVHRPRTHAAVLEPLLGSVGWWL